MTADTRAIGRTLRVGTRKSTLALRQTDEVVRALTRAHPGLEVTTCPFETTGDRRQSAMSTTSGKGEFTKELEDARITAERRGGEQSGLKSEDISSLGREALSSIDMSKITDLELIDAIIARSFALEKEKR